MRANTFGSHFQLSTFGESHGKALGALIMGCPAGVPFSYKLLKEKLEKRRPGFLPWVSARKEPDIPEVLSGVFEDKTLGTPLAVIIKNKDFKPQDYKDIKKTPRTGHADDVWKNKFQHFDHRGGGRASGRETTARVIGGFVAEMFVKTIYPNLKVLSLAHSIGPFTREDFTDLSLNNWFGKQTKKVSEFLMQKKQEGLSYGGAVKVVIQNAPAGLGQPVFRKLKSDFAGAYMSIGACYEVSLGCFKNISRQEGSILHSGKNLSVYGGIRGGISTGEDIIFYLKFKAPSSVLDTAKKGRHDPCIVPRALAVVEAMTYLVLADHILWRRLDVV